MSFYDQYKPFRNLVRRFDLPQSLVDIWAYSAHVQGHQPLPKQFLANVAFHTRNRLPELIYPWELATLAREVVLTAGRGGDRSLQQWRELSQAINHVKHLDGEGYQAKGGGPADIMFELHRIAHRQFPWQDRATVNDMMRLLKVFGRAEVDEIVSREFGVPMKEFFLFAFALTRYFQREYGLTTHQDYSVINIPREVWRQFLERISSPAEALRAEAERLQSYDCDWLYTFNPLEAKPLVQFDPSNPDRVICPIPHFLAKRVTTGIYYDLVAAKGFDRAFGPSFQAYIGEVAAKVCRIPQFRLLSVEPYAVNRSPRHGADWILSDDTGHIFIEVKTKRLTAGARTSGDPQALDKDVGIMAEAIVQNRNNIEDARAGLTNWQSDGLPVYSLVITLEDWLLFAPGGQEMLNAHLTRLLGLAGETETIFEKAPYTVLSAAEFETVIQVIAQVGVRAVMERTAADFSIWSFMPRLTERFPDAVKRVSYRIFDDEFLATHPNQRAAQALRG